MKAIYWLSVASFLSLVMSMGVIAYLCKEGGCYGIKNISFGDASVAVLGAIVGLLVGWQIYNVLDLNKRVKEIDDKNEIIINNTENALVDIQRKCKEAIEKCDELRCKTEEYAIGMSDFVQGLVFMKEEPMVSYRMFVSSILHFTRCDNQVQTNIDSSLSNMEYCLDLNQDDFDEIGEKTSFEIAVDEIMQSDSKEFTRKQKERFILIENRRKNKIK